MSRIKKTEVSVLDTDPAGMPTVLKDYRKKYRATMCICVCELHPETQQIPNCTGFAGKFAHKTKYSRLES